MEFQGRIARLLPIRQGVSQRTGNEWKSLPFIFEYFENPSDRYADSVMLETFDTNVIDNLKEGMEVRCGFGHRTREYTKEGKSMIINDIRLYKIEGVHKQTAKVQPDGGTGAAPSAEQSKTGDAMFSHQDDSNNNHDDLPF